MEKRSQSGILSKLRQFLLRVRRTPLTIRLRLLGFLLGLILLLFLVVIVILLLTGTLTSGQKELDEYFNTELERLSADIELDYGRISASAVSLAESIAEASEQLIMQRGGDMAALQSRPDLLQELLDSNFDRLVFSLEKTGASGAFIILDATVNQAIENAGQSRAGLYIKSLEPNIISVSQPEMTVLRGFADLGRKRGYALHSLWSMEFDIRNTPEYEIIRQQTLLPEQQDLTRLYLWGAARTVEGSSELYMPCIVPLLDSKGSFFGVCGFEVSSMLFKLNYKPLSTNQYRVNCLIAPADDRGLVLTGALAGGDFNSFSAFINKARSLARLEDNSDRQPTDQSWEAAAWLKPVSRRSQLFLYRFEGSNLPPGDTAAELRTGPGSIFAGRHRPLKLLPNDSVFSDMSFASLLIIPESEFSSILADNNLKIAALFILFILSGVLAAVFISKRFVGPIVRGLEAAASTSFGQHPASNIAEINELIDQLREHYRNRTGQSLPADLFGDFLGRLETLTPTEKIITGCYMRGESTKNILGKLYISASTLKTHSSHIYSKLNISSREELHLYYRLLDKSGRLAELAQITDVV